MHVKDEKQDVDAQTALQVTCDPGHQDLNNHAQLKKIWRK